MHRPSLVNRISKGVTMRGKYGYISLAYWLISDALWRQPACKVIWASGAMLCLQSGLLVGANDEAQRYDTQSSTILSGSTLPFPVTSRVTWIHAPWIGFVSHHRGEGIGDSLAIFRIGWLHHQHCDAEVWFLVYLAIQSSSSWNISVSPNYNCKRLL